MDAEELPPGWAWATLDNFVRDRGVSVDPARWPEKRFTLYSVPAHALGKPEILYGKDIGSTKQAIVPGTVLLSKINPRINRVWITADHGPNASLLGSTEWITFPPSAQVNADYLKFFLMRENVRRYLTENVSGVGGSLMRVNTEVVGKIEMPVAPASEQLRIAAAVNTLFEELDEAEAALARAREGVEQFRASLLHAACTGQLTAAWREANPPTETGADLLRRILAERRATWERTERARLEAKGTPPRGDAWKARYVEPVAPDLTDLPDLPKGWVWASLPQLGHFGRGKSKHRPRGDLRLYGDAIPFVQTGDVSRSGGRIESFTQRYSEFGIAQSKIWPQGTVCITIAANIAASGILGFDSCFPDSVVGLICDDQLVARYVEFFIRTARANLAEYAPATAQKNINLETLNALAVPLPPLTEIKEIIETIENSTDVVASLPSVSSDELRQSILHAAFTGRLVPQHPADEPATAMLDRLRNTASPSRRARSRNTPKVPA